MNIYCVHIIYYVQREGAQVPQPPPLRFTLAYSIHVCCYRYCIITIRVYTNGRGRLLTCDVSGDDDEIGFSDELTTAHGSLTHAAAAAAAAAPTDRYREPDEGNIVTTSPPYRRAQAPISGRATETFVDSLI